MFRDQDIDRDKDAEKSGSPQRKMPTDFVLVGEVGCGKTALVNALLQTGEQAQKTQSVEFHRHNVVDTPGEFGGRRTFYRALLASIVEIPTVVYLQPANSQVFSLPTGLLTVYPNKQVVGVISKVDLPEADVPGAEKLLLANGIAAPHFATSAVTGAGVADLRDYLIGLQEGPPDSGPAKSPRQAA